MCLGAFVATKIFLCQKLKTDGHYKAPAFQLAILNFELWFLALNFKFSVSFTADKTMYINLRVEVPAIIEHICLWFLLRYRKRHYGFTFRKIPLSKGEFAIVDVEDFESLSKFSWYVMAGTHSFYAYRSITVFGKNKVIAMHRQIMPPPDGYVVDHENHEGLDNRKANLRLATISQNNCNRRRSPNIGRSKYKGIDFDDSRKKWRARIRFNNKRVFLGYFDNEIDAAKAYDAAARKLHGDFAVLNFG